MSVAAPTACALCGLDVGSDPYEQRVDDDVLRFCCDGCLNVHAILRESGLVRPGVDLRDTELFKRSLALGLVSAGRERAATERERGIPADAPTKDVVLHVSGMWCASCGWLIEHALASEPGVRTAEVVFASDLLKLRYCPQYVPPDRIPARLSSLGYRVSEYTGDDTAADAERRDLWLRVGIATFLWLNVMMLNLAIYVGYFQSIPASVRTFLPWVLATLSAPAVFWCAWPIHRLAIGGLRNGVVRMETLLSLGIVAAWGYSIAETARGGDLIYFDTACAIVTFVLVGKTVERGAREKTSRAIRLMHHLMPRKARVVTDGRERFVAVDDLRPGDRVLVKAGERLPVDGEVVTGRSHVDESLLTGESAPVGKGPGSTVASGSVNLDSVLEIVATRTGAASTLARLVQMVEQALSGRSALERRVDRVSRAFVPAVVVLALATWLGWWLAGGLPFGDALLRAVTVLVIACPCALGIATPLALTAAVGAASRAGILVGHSAALETVRRVDLVVFDKTGTVTTGEFSWLAGGEDDLAAIAAVERYSEHPLGRAIVRAAEEHRVPQRAAAGVTVRKGFGIVGTVDGRRIAVGSRRLFADRIDPALDEAARAREAAGDTVVFHGTDTCAEGFLVFGDRVAPGAAPLVAALRARGIRTMLVSGDARPTVEHIAARLGVDEAHAEALPEDKERLVESLVSQGRVVAMVGDGINDAPALARASLGVAVASGTDLAMKAAAVVLMNNDLGKLLEAIDLARRTFHVVRQNLFWAFFYNTAALALAVAGVINPIIAAAGMVLSSVSVVLNSYRLGRERRAPNRGLTPVEA